MTHRRRRVKEFARPPGCLQLVTEVAEVTEKSCFLMRGHERTSKVMDLCYGPGIFPSKLSSRRCRKAVLIVSELEIELSKAPEDDHDDE